MGLCRAHASGRLAGLQHHQRLALYVAPCGEFGEARAIAKTLDIERDGVRPRIIDEVFEEVAYLNVSLVAERDAGTEADRVSIGAVEQGHHQRPALADQAQSAGQQPVHIQHDGGTEGEGVVRIQQTHAIGPDDAHAHRFRNVENTLLQRRAGLIGLGEPGGDDDAATDAGCGTFADRRQKMRSGDSKDRHVHGFGDRRQAGIGPVAADLAALRVDRHDAAGEAWRVRK